MKYVQHFIDTYEVRGTMTTKFRLWRKEGSLPNYYEVHWWLYLYLTALRDVHARDLLHFSLLSLPFHGFFPFNLSTALLIDLFNLPKDREATADEPSFLPLRSNSILSALPSSHI